MEYFVNFFGSTVLLKNTMYTDYNIGELKGIVADSEAFVKEIQGLLPLSMPKSNAKVNPLHFDVNIVKIECDIRDNDVIIQISEGQRHYYEGMKLDIRKDSIKSTVYKEGNYSSNISVGALFELLKVKDSILTFVRNYVNMRNKAVDNEKGSSSATSVSPKLDSAYSYFERAFHNTGKTLKSVVKDMQGKGYSKSDIVSAILNVLGDVNWND